MFGHTLSGNNKAHQILSAFVVGFISDDKMKTKIEERPTA
jgi:hypothetical protein